MQGTGGGGGERKTDGNHLLYFCLCLAYIHTRIRLKQITKHEEVFCHILLKCFNYCFFNRHFPNSLNISGKYHGTHPIFKISEMASQSKTQIQIVDTANHHATSVLLIYSAYLHTNIHVPLLFNIPNPASNPQRFCAEWIKINFKKPNLNYNLNFKNCFIQIIKNI